MYVVFGSGEVSCLKEPFATSLVIFATSLVIFDNDCTFHLWSFPIELSKKKFVTWRMIVCLIFHILSKNKDQRWFAHCSFENESYAVGWHFGGFNDFRPNEFETQSSYKI